MTRSTNTSVVACAAYVHKSRCCGKTRKIKAEQVGFRLCFDFPSVKCAIIFFFMGDIDA